MCLFVERNYTLSRCTAQRLKKQWHLQNKQSSAYSHITASISYKIISFHKSTKEHLLNRAQLTQVHTRVLYDAIFLHMFIYIYEKSMLLITSFQVDCIGRLEGQAIILSNFFMYPIKLKFMLHVASNFQHFVGTE